jgi:hypothetical protein
LPQATQSFPTLAAFFIVKISNLLHHLSYF